MNLDHIVSFWCVYLARTGVTIYLWPVDNATTAKNGSNKERCTIAGQRPKRRSH